MNAEHPDLTTSAESTADRQPFSRRRLFEFGGAAAAMAAILAACGGDDGGDPGRVGLAAAVTDLPDEDVDDAVLLRTLQSLEYSILGIYERFAADAGLEGAAAAALERFTADHTAAAEAYDELIGTVDGESYPCPNPWYESRFFEPALANIFGGSNAEGEIPPSDDIPRDVLAVIQALEALSTASALHFISKLSTPELRSGVIGLGSQAARRSATATLLVNPPTAGYVAADLILADGGEVEEAPATTTPATEPAATEAPTDGSEAAEAAPAPAPTPIPLPHVISARFAQLTAVNIEIGAVNDLGLRYKAAWDTPAENAFVYNSLACSA